MNEKITFYVFRNAGLSISRATISKSLLRVFILLGIVGLFSVGFVVYDYAKLKKSQTVTRFLENRILSQNQTIADQRQQIQGFAEEINQLKTKLVEINAFEKKIRIIANVEKPSGQDTLFGVGGSIPDDLEATIDVTKNHSTLLRAMHEHVDQLHLASKIQKEDFESLLSNLEDQRNLLACTPSIRPTKGWVTSRFGSRVSPFTGRKEFHKGLDIATRKGTPIHASADGVVTSVGSKGLLGRVIVINHGHGMVSRYAHLDKMVKKQGDRVKRGDVIATVGNSGRTTGPHLHYEVHLNGLPVNPEKYILD